MFSNKEAKKEKYSQSDIFNLEHTIVDELVKKEKKIKADLQCVDNANRSISKSVEFVQNKFEEYNVNLFQLKSNDCLLQEKMKVVSERSKDMQEKLETKFFELFQTMQTEMKKLDTNLESLEKKVQDRSVHERKEQNIFECNECGMGFHLEYHYKNHQVKKHTNKSVICDECNIKFPNPEHYAGHLKKKHRAE